MNPFTAFIRRFPQGVFWGIAYIIAGGGYILGRLYPNDLWILVLWGIFLGGALVAGVVDGRAGLRSYFGRLFRWRAGIQWYLIALLTPFVLGFIAFGLSSLSGAEVTGSFPEFGTVLMVFVFSFLTIALGEEPGIRGFSLARFLKDRSAFSAGLIVGILHAIWHLPLVIGGEEPAIFLLNPLGASILFTWIFNHTNGSVLIAMLLHASSDAAGGFFGSLFSDADAMVNSIWLGAAFIAVAILLRLFAGRELGRKPQAAIEAPAAGRSLAAN